MAKIAEGDDNMAYKLLGINTENKHSIVQNTY